ncbi:MAG: 30S ribosomal protein S6 [Phycisphaeraceae bacterium]|nr:30S ribosomal protein S6 [Phycisphaeraceae bacterium]
MSEQRIGTYEGLFLLSQAASADLAASIEYLQQVLGRAQAEILVLNRWEERRLAYPIRSQKRGVYLLCYFKAPHSQIISIERDCRLSEQIVRFMILRADYMGEPELEVARKAADIRVEARLRSETGEPGAAEEPAEATAPGNEE